MRLAAPRHITYPAKADHKRRLLGRSLNESQKITEGKQERGEDE